MKPKAKKGWPKVTYQLDPRSHKGMAATDFLLIYAICAACLIGALAGIALGSGPT